MSFEVFHSRNVEVGVFALQWPLKERNLLLENSQIVIWEVIDIIHRLQHLNLTSAFTFLLSRVQTRCKKANLLKILFFLLVYYIREFAIISIHNMLCLIMQEGKNHRKSHLICHIFHSYKPTSLLCYSMQHCDILADHHCRADYIWP